MKSNNVLSESAGSVMIIDNPTDLDYDNNSINEDGGIDTAIRSDLMEDTEIQI
jgi:hypothetical protein